jgi:hypothetical protein
MSPPRGEQVAVPAVHSNLWDAGPEIHAVAAIAVSDDCELVMVL